MIEPTDEMVQAFDAGYTTNSPNAIRPIPSVRAGLAAVIALIERDYDVRRKTGPRSHEFLRGDNPNFGSAFGGSCVAVTDGTVCGWPEHVHRL